MLNCNHVTWTSWIHHVTLLASVFYKEMHTNSTLTSISDYTPPIFLDWYKIARLSRGTGQRTQVKATIPLPCKIAIFFRRMIPTKRSYCIFYLLKVEMKCPSNGKTLISTFGTKVQCTDVDGDTSKIEPCSHGNSDTRTMVPGLQKNFNLNC